MRANALVYLKEADDHRLLARKRLKLSAPVLDLSALNLSGREAAVLVKKRTADRLFGRQIKTIISEDCIIRVIVDKRGGDFWYAVNASNIEEQEEEED